MSETESRHATVNVWSGGPRADYDDLLATEPDEFEMPIVPADTYHVPHEDHVVLADCIENHGRYAFDMEADTAAVLVIETSDHYHDTLEGYTTGRPIEGGLLYRPENTDEPPFQSEIWGCIRMRIESADSE